MIFTTLKFWGCKLWNKSYCVQSADVFEFQVIICSSSPLHFWWVSLQFFLLLLGEVQWSCHLKTRQTTLSLYPELLSAGSGFAVSGPPLWKFRSPWVSSCWWGCPFFSCKKAVLRWLLCDGALLAVRWLILAMESSSFRFGETCQYLLGQEECRADRGWSSMQSGQCPHRTSPQHRICECTSV